mgnify:FL=1|tara:strand:- start:523 stop:840 length:318 start_codon:yes stop_codon:yes gene_type:complete
MSYRLTFTARDGHPDNVDRDEPVKWFENTYDTVAEAEAVIQNTDHIKWKWEKDDDEDQWVTISFKREPKIENTEGNYVSCLEYTRYYPMDIQWTRTKHYESPKEP